jgi:hypothetical protein
VEVPGDRQLEGALPVGVRIPLAQSGCLQLAPGAQNPGVLHPLGEASFELGSMFLGHRTRRDQRQPGHATGIIHGPATLHSVLKGWLASLGQPVGNDR